MISDIEFAGTDTIVTTNTEGETQFNSGTKIESRQELQAVIRKILTMIMIYITYI